jgi:hypothetical protein
MADGTLAVPIDRSDLTHADRVETLLREHLGAALRNTSQLLRTKADGTTGS